MINLLKFFESKRSKQKSTEAATYTVEWEVISRWGGDPKKQYKVFMSQDDAIKFRYQISKSAWSLGCWFKSDIYRN